MLWCETSSDQLVRNLTSPTSLLQLKQDPALNESASRKKEVGNLVRLLVEVENGLNSAEIAEIAAQADEVVATRYMNDALLDHLPTPPPESTYDKGYLNTTDGSNRTTESSSDVLVDVDRSLGIPNKAGPTDAAQPNNRNATLGKGRAEERKEQDGEGAYFEADPIERLVLPVAGCQVRCCLMVDRQNRRLVVAVGDSLTGAALLGSLYELPEPMQLASHGLMRETMFVNRRVFQAACDLLEWAGPHIKASISSGAFQDFKVHCAGHSFSGAVAAIFAGLLEGSIDVDFTVIGSRGGEQQSSESEQGDNTSDMEEEDDENDTEDGGESPLGGGAAPWIGSAPGRVTCVTLGCPPCVSSNMRLPFVTSFVLGDDMIPRTSYQSLRRLKKRLVQVMPRSKGLLSQGMAFGTSLFTDVAGVALQGVRQATTSGEDDAGLGVPGRVWFLKPRRLHNGATMARVMRGNLREDMLWQLHDIMLTKSMFAHHSLDKYIQILDRV
ncbi:unnamed protein product [Choristocarpus tenellus]